MRRRSLPLMRGRGAAWPLMMNAKYAVESNDFKHLRALPGRLLDISRKLKRFLRRVFEDGKVDMRPLDFSRSKGFARGKVSRKYLKMRWRGRNRRRWARFRPCYVQLLGVKGPIYLI